MLVSSTSRSNRRHPTVRARAGPTNPPGTHGSSPGGKPRTASGDPAPAERPGGRPEPPDPTA
eukprot:5801436-Lingulodinium_polyedra.AAC.1